MLPRTARLFVLADPEGFQAFYKQAFPPVYSFFLHRCDGEATAEDLTQITFMAAVHQIKQGTVVESPIGWIMGIARHKLIDHYRGLARNERNLELAWSAPDVDPPSELIPDRDLALTALRAVAADQRAALVLHYLDDLPVREISEILGRSVRATESLLARGRESFKRHYAEITSD